MIKLFYSSIKWSTSKEPIVVKYEIPKDLVHRDVEMSHKAIDESKIIKLHESATTVVVKIPSYPYKQRLRFRVPTKIGEHVSFSSYNNKTFLIKKIVLGYELYVIYEDSSSKIGKIRNISDKKCLKCLRSVISNEVPIDD